MPFNPGSLRRASFNGVPFWVLHGEIEAGHRVSTTHIPAGKHINESFGPSARKFEIDAYVAGDGLFAADALLLAAEAMHVGALILPDQLGAAVRLTKAKRRFDRDKLGYISVEIEAVSEPSFGFGLGGLISIFAFGQQIYAATAALVGLFGQAASSLSVARALFRSSAVLPGSASIVVSDISPALESSSTAAATIAADLVAVSTLCRFPPESQARFDAALAVVLATIPTIQSSPESFGSALAEAAIVLGDEAEPSRLMEALLILGAPSAPPPAASATATDQVIAIIAATAPRLVAAARALAVAQSQARAEWPDRPSALRARATAAAVFDDARARLGQDGVALHRALSDLRGVVTERATQAAASLAPLITVSANLRLPSLAWAWRLYADPRRSADLVSRSGASHPSFLPERFEAPAR